MPKATRKKESSVLYVREAPPELSRKLKAAAALEGKTLQQYLLALFTSHVEDLEKKGVLPKGKGVQH